jgi:hypothetical protein
MSRIILRSLLIDRARRFVVMNARGAHAATIAIAATSACEADASSVDG